MMLYRYSMLELASYEPRHDKYNPVLIGWFRRLRPNILLDAALDMDYTIRLEVLFPDVKLCADAMAPDGSMIQEAYFDQEFEFKRRGHIWLVPSYYPQDDGRPSGETGDFWIRETVNEKYG